jgi:microcystin-dependent protein
MITPFAGVMTDQVIVKLAKAGWLPCDGRSLSMDAFPELWETIGTVWGVQPDQGKFNLPDLRGRFLVGVPEKTQDANKDQTKQVGDTLGIEKDNHILKEWQSSGRCRNCKPWSADSAYQPKEQKDQRFADKGHWHNVRLPPSSVVSYIIKVK